MRKISIAMAIVMMMLSSILTGCGKSNIGNISVEAGESALYIQSDGTVSYVICEDFGEDYYDKGELKKLIKEEIDSFNVGASSSTMDSAKLESFKVKKDIANVIISFKTLEDYANYAIDYNGESDKEIFVGTVADAVDAGYKFSGDYKVVENGEVTEDTADASTVKATEGNVIYLKEQMKIQIDKASIKYITTNCVIENGVISITDDEKAIIVYE